MPCIGPPSARAFSKRSECVMPRPAIIQFTSFGLDRLLHADAVAMHDLAGEQVGDRGESDVRMRAHVDRLRECPGEKCTGPM